MPGLKLNHAIEISSAALKEESVESSARKGV